MFRQLNRFRFGQGGRVRTVLGTAIVLALVISPFAVAQSTGLIGGKRNPKSGAFTAETKAWSLRIAAGRLSI